MSHQRVAVRLRAHGQGDEGEAEGETRARERCGPALAWRCCWRTRARAPRTVRYAIATRICNTKIACVQVQDDVGAAARR